MRMKVIARQGIALLLAVLSLLSLVVGAMALEYDGNGTDGGYASQTGSGKYGIISTNTSTNVIGYRFTGLKDGGTTKTDSIDVMLDNSWFTDYMSWGDGDVKYDNLYMMSPKYSKMDYHAAYLNYAKSGNWSAFDAVAAEEDTYKAPRNTIWESSLACPEKIPKTSAELDAWQKKALNLNPVALKLGFNGGLAKMRKGDKIIAEPLFCLLLEGHYYAITLSELATCCGFTVKNMGDNGSLGTGNSDGGKNIRWRAQVHRRSLHSWYDNCRAGRKPR